MRVILLVLLLVGCGGAHAQWTDEQKTLAAIAFTAMAIDYGQTKFVVKNYRTYDWHENNPMLGRYPSMGRVNQHFAISAAASYLIADYLPSEQRTWALRGLALVQVGIVAHNYSLGLRTSF